MKTTHLLILIVIIGLVFRVYVAVTIPISGDQLDYVEDVEIIARGGNLYAEQAGYNFAPTFAYILYVTDAIGKPFHIPLYIGIRFWLIFVDALVALGIALIANEIKPDSGAISLITYWLDPAVIVNVAYWSQFENFAMLPLETQHAAPTHLLKIYPYQRGSGGPGIKLCCT